MEDLRRRIGCTRLPKAFKARSWNLGMDDDYLSSLLEYWRNGYDWTQKERGLNRYAIRLMKQTTGSKSAEQLKQMHNQLRLPESP